ncbi:MAG TPA: hypothetical protein VM513_11550 [Kofleriaceae bacterium]|nr:hypothetical protein [Kofleriaceae bacterium]
MEDRGSKDDPFDAPEWWLAIARDVLRRTPETQSVLVKRLAELVGREWDRSKISNFVGGAKPTRLFAEALCRYFPQIPRPMFVPRNELEARAMQAVADLAAGKISQSEPPKIRIGAKEQKLRELDADLDQLELEGRQMGSVESDDEVRAPRRGRPRRLS